MPAELQDRWIEELKSISVGSWQHRYSGSTPTVVRASSDLLGWLADSRPFAGYHGKSWNSAIADFDIAVASMHSELRTQVANELSLVQGLLATRPQSLKEKHVALWKNKAAASQALVSLLDALNSGEAVAAAWRDLVAVSKDLTYSTAIVHLCRNSLIDICHLRGLNTGTHGVLSSTVGILNDSAYEVASAESRLSKTDPPNLRIEDIESRANLDIDDRLRLCEQVLKLPAEEASMVVWLQVEGASLQGVVSDFGAVMLYDSEWLAGNAVGDERPHLDSLPDELKDPDNRISHFEFEAANDRLFARVDVGSGSTATAVGRARDVLYAFISRGGPSAEHWRILGSYVSFRNGKLAGSKMSREHLIGGEYYPHLDPVRDVLAEYARDGVKVTAEVDQVLYDALHLRRQLTQVQKSDDIVQINTAVRAIEHVNSWVTGGLGEWDAFALEYLRGGWVQSALINDFDHVTWYALHNTHSEDTSLSEGVQSLWSKVFFIDGKYQDRINRMRIIGSLPELQTIYSGRTLERTLREYSSIFANGPSLAQECVRLEEAFDRLIPRLLRYRNAGQHGGPKDEESVPGLAPFALTLAFQALRIVIDALLIADDPRAQAEADRDMYSQRVRNLMAGADVDALWT